jgi:hypothetical protein
MLVNLEYVFLMNSYELMMMMPKQWKMFVYSIDNATYYYHSRVHCLNETYLTSDDLHVHNNHLIFSMVLEHRQATRIIINKHIKNIRDAYVTVLTVNNSIA